MEFIKYILRINWMKPEHKRSSFIVQSILMAQRGKETFWKHDDLMLSTADAAISKAEILTIAWFSRFNLLAWKCRKYVKCKQGLTLHNNLLNPVIIFIVQKRIKCKSKLGILLFLYFAGRERRWSMESWVWLHVSFYFKKKFT